MKGCLISLVFLVSALGTFGAKIGNTTVDDDFCWAPHNRLKHDSSMRPFKVKFTREMISDLRYRLQHTRPLAPPLEGVGFSYGYNSHDIDSWITYWAEDYPFEDREHYLNQFPQFKTRIQCLDIHFLHVKPKVRYGVKVVPMLLLHGFPGSVREFYEAIPMMTEVSKDRDFALEVIIPSLPGFGFSDPARVPGLGILELAVVFRNLMNRLGFEKYYVQGGDWGAFIVSNMATLFPEEVMGHHTNLAVSSATATLMTWALGSFHTDAVVDESLEDRMYPISEIGKYYMQEFGYFHIQATKPDTIGTALSDSPIGLLTWVFQLMAMSTRKSSTYSKTGELLKFYSRETLIDNLMYYWATNSITTACRIYAETANFRTLGSGVLEMPTPVPTWTVHAKDEIMYQSPTLLKFKYPNLIHSTVFDDYGHHLAMEVPEVFTRDLLNAVKAFRKLDDRHFGPPDESSQCIDKCRYYDIIRN